MNECLFRKCQLRGFHSRKKRSLLIVNEYFGDKCNEASGTLWTDTSDKRSAIHVCIGGLIAGLFFLLQNVIFVFLLNF